MHFNYLTLSDEFDTFLLMGMIYDAKTFDMLCTSMFKSSEITLPRLPLLLKIVWTSMLLPLASFATVLLKKSLLHTKMLWLNSMTSLKRKSTTSQACTLLKENLAKATKISARDLWKNMRMELEDRALSWHNGLQKQWLLLT